MNDNERRTILTSPRWRRRLRRFNQRVWAVARWEYVEFPRELARIARESLRGGER